MSGTSSVALGTVPDAITGALLARIAPSPDVHVVDVGGGSGARAVPLAVYGCAVTVVDVSTDALASLARRAGEAGVADRITAIQADADQLTEVLAAGSTDLVLFHRMVDQVADPAAVLTQAASLLRPGGTLSVVVPGRLAAVVAAVAAGRLDRAGALLDAAEADVAREWDLPELRALLERTGLVVEETVGVGVLATLAADRFRGSSDPAVGALETALGQHPVLGRLAGEIHALASKPFA